MTTQYSEADDATTGGPAFPQPDHQKPGLTFREYLAALAMQSLLTGQSDPANIDNIAAAAWIVADAMLASPNRNLAPTSTLQPATAKKARKS